MECGGLMIVLILIKQESIYEEENIWDVRNRISLACLFNHIYSSIPIWNIAVVSNTFMKIMAIVIFRKRAAMTQ